ncbi:hypothetical protein PG357_10530, partial [Riemerella anatipestifer]|nr:hypothetical protein [Riemerella anatipestifer]
VSLDGLHQMISANNVPMARLGLGVGESFVYSIELMNYLHSRLPIVNLSRNIIFYGNQNISGMLVSIVKSGNILKIFYSFKDFSDMAVYTIDTTRNYNLLGVFSNTYLKGTMRCSVIKSIQF